MGSFKEVAAVFVSPAIKLVETVSGAIGKAYEPTHIKRMAKARAKEIEEIGRALRENADIPIEYIKGEITADTKDFDEFVKRTQSRMAFQELQKQQNIESVADMAYDLLEEETECSEEPVDNDWLSRFFNSVENISDSDMQLLWAKILAGEVKKPKTYSVRTLEALKNLSKDEALLYQKLTPYVFSSAAGKYVASKSKLLKKYNIEYQDIILLIECGLLTSTDFMSLSIALNKEREKYAIHNDKRVVIFEYKNEHDIDVQIDVYGLTTAGRELFDVVKKEFNNEYILDLAGDIFNYYSEHVKVKVFEVKCIDGMSIDYEDVPIKVFEK